MIITALIWLYITILPYLYGLLVVQTLAKVLGFSARISFILVWLTGVVSLTTVAAFFSLAMPISGVFHLIIFSIGVFLFVRFLKNGGVSIQTFLASMKKVHWLTLILGFLVVVALLEISTRTPGNPDSGQYHAQAIRWIETYRIVPGLGNLLTRFAFNSSWFIFNSIFSLAFLGGRSFHLVGSVFFLLVAFYSLSAVDSLIKKEFRFSVLFRAFLLPFAFNFLASEASSPGTDLPITLISWILVAEWLNIIDKGKERAVEASAIWMVAVFSVTIKLSAVLWVLGGLFIFLLVRENLGKRFLLINLGLGLMILSPWVARNVIISGYLIYPFPAIDLFRVDWKIPLSNALSDMSSIQNWAKLSGAATTFNNHLPLSQWLPDWLNHQTRITKLVMGTLILSPAVLILLAFIPWKGKMFLQQLLKPYLPVYIFVYIGGVFWFFTSPALRFGYGFIVPGLILALIPYLLLTTHYFPMLKDFAGYLILGILIAYQVYVLVFSVETRTLPRRLVLPADYRELPTEPCQLTNTIVHKPSSEAWMECWYSPFPCTPHCEAGVELRGTSLQDGFRWAASND